MKIILVLLFVGSIAASVPAYASSRVLVCSKASDQVSFSLCGVRGCTATVDLQDEVPTDYPVTRTKADDGTLLYRATASAPRRCRFRISPLQNGVRTMTNAPKCAPVLAGSTCKFHDA